MPQVMARRDWQGVFKRAVRDKDGEVVLWLEFEPGLPLDLSAEEFELVRDDIGRALQIVTPDERGRPSPLSAEDTTKFLAGKLKLPKPKPIPEHLQEPPAEGGSRRREPEPPGEPAGDPGDTTFTKAVPEDAD